MLVGACLKPARNRSNYQTENGVSYNICHLENPQTSVEKLPNGENRNMGKQIEFIEPTFN